MNMRAHYLIQVGLLLSLSLLTAAPLSAAASANAVVNSSALKEAETYHRFIVEFDGTTRENPGKLSKILDNITSSQRLTLQLRRELATGAHLVEVNNRLSHLAAQALMDAFGRQPGVIYVEPDVLMQAQYTPNDEFYSLQWHYHEPVGGLNLPLAWDESQGDGVIVAVLDTGRVNHPDLMANLVPGYDFISDPFVSRDGDGRDVDPNDEGDWNPKPNECYRGSPRTNSSWHGTHVAGTIAALSNNGQGVAGVAFDAQVQHLRVLGRCGGYLSDIADAIVWASGGAVNGIAQNPTPAQVINMSLGGGGSCGSTYQNAINSAVNNGALVVVSAGNSNADASGSRPANCGNVVTVAATNRQGDRSYYSNYGNSVDVSAPGGDLRYEASDGIASTLNSGTTTQSSHNYVYYQGTSMAAPHVSGLAALVYSVHGNPTPASVSQIITDTARPLPGSCSGGCGAGIADATAAVLAAKGLTPQNNNPLTADFSSSCSDLTCTFTNSSSGEGSITYSWVFGDGNSSSATNPTHTYSQAGTFGVTLVANNGTETSEATGEVTVSNPLANVAPTAGYMVTTDGLTASFTDTSTDSDGDIAEWHWDFGDGNTATAQNPDHTYGAAGSYTVILTVTDDDNATADVSHVVTVEEPVGTTELTIDSISPNTMPSGSIGAVTIYGSGFEPGATISFINGSGPTPTASDVVVTADTINATITAKDGGPRRNRIWDVVVTNPGGTSAVLPGGLTITR